MKRPGRLRTPLIVLVALLVFVGGSLFATHLYLRSQGLADRIAARLQKVLGGTVRIGHADVGLHGGSTLRDIEVYEDGAKPGAPPWIKIKELGADVSALSYLRGEATPQAISLRDAKIVLRFDRHDHLLTRIGTGAGAAKTFPRVHIEQGQLTIEQEDHPPMVIPGITADFTSQEEVFKVDGTIANPGYWGDWKVQGSFDSSRGHPTSGDVALALDTDHARVNPDKLHHVAFVPKKVWDDVQAEGTTPCHFTLNFNTGKKGVTYTVQLHPKDARVEIPSIDLKGPNAATHASGKVVVKDEVVTLDGVHGELAGGTIATSGVLDFASTPDKFTFKVRLKNVRIEQLPASWKKNDFVRSLKGDLTGQASLVVTYDKGKVHASGWGEGEVTHGMWGSIPIQSARLRLVPSPSGKGFDLAKDGDKAAE